MSEPPHGLNVEKNIAASDPGLHCLQMPIFVQLLRFITVLWIMGESRHGLSVKKNIADVILFYNYYCSEKIRFGS